MVAPLLFLPFVENAFKHGASEQLEKPWISVDLSVKKDTLIFKMINSLDPGYVPSNGHGLGMRNITKRLDLLYSDKHELAFGPHEDYYLVSLTLQTT
jgi:sensor histidine kinase YesM